MSDLPVTDVDAELPGIPSATRRKFMHRMLNMTLGFWALAGVSGSAYVAGQYVWPRKKTASTGGERSLSFPLAELKDGGMVKKLVNGQPVGIFSVDGEYHAVHLVCTHLGCLVGFDKKAKALACPCHGSRFDASGAVLQGPAPSPLRAYEVRVAGDTVIVS